MTRRQPALLAPNSSVYNEYGKISVSGFCSAEKEKAEHLLGFSLYFLTNDFKTLGFFSEASWLTELAKNCSASILFHPSLSWHLAS